VAILVLGVILSIAMAVTSLTRYFGTVAENVALQGTRIATLTKV